MGVRFTSDENITALFDSVTGWAFGPTFDTADDAQAFLDWCSDQGVRGGDVRSISLRELEKLASRYYAPGGPGHERA